MTLIHAHMKVSIFFLILYSVEKNKNYVMTLVSYCHTYFVLYLYFKCLILFLYTYNLSYF